MVLLILQTGNFLLECRRQIFAEFKFGHMAQDHFFSQLAFDKPLRTVELLQYIIKGLERRRDEYVGLYQVAAQ
jgi:hypothetical protein